MQWILCFSHLLIQLPRQPPGPRAHVLPCEVSLGAVQGRSAASSDPKNIQPATGTQSRRNSARTSHARAQFKDAVQYMGAGSVWFTRSSSSSKYMSFHSIVLYPTLAPCLELLISSCWCTSHQSLHTSSRHEQVTAAETNLLRSPLIRKYRSLGPVPCQRRSSSIRRATLFPFRLDLPPSHRSDRRVLRDSDGCIALKWPGAAARHSHHIVIQADQHPPPSSAWSKTNSCTIETFQRGKIDSAHSLYECAKTTGLCVELTRAIGDQYLP